MSDDGLLSQEDIDALTSGLFGENGEVVADPDVSAAAPVDGGGMDGGDLGGDGGGDGGGDQFVDPEELRPLFKIVTNQASGVISTAINKNVEYKIEEVVGCSEESAGGTFADKHLVVTVGFEGDISGQLGLVYSQKDTAVMSDLMMMGDGSAEFEEDHKEALAELINQVMGSVNTSISSDFDIQISIGQAETVDYSVSDQVLVADGSVLGRVSYSVEGILESEMLLIADQSLSENFYAKVKGGGDSFELAPTEEEGSLAGFDAEPGPMDSGVAAPAVASGAATLFESTGNRALDMLLDIPLDITIELGRCNMSIRKILELGPGSVVEMDRFAGEPVDLLINDKVVARGEVVVVDENFGIRVVSLVTPEERLKFLK
ncbi:MAG: flagellar motor switch protein FliN [Fibrobacterales bacterium]